MKEIKRIKKEELEEIKKFFKRKKNLKIRIKKLKNEILKNFKNAIFLSIFVIIIYVFFYEIDFRNFFTNVEILINFKL